MKKRYKAVTLIEFLIAMVIAGILAAVSISSMQSARTFSRLQAAQREVAAAIKLAQTFASQGKTQIYAGTTYTPCGYGFRFKPPILPATAVTDYEIFYNLPGTRGCAGDNGKNNTSDDTTRKFRHFIFGEAIANDNSWTSEDQLLNGGVKLSDPAVSELYKTEIYFTVPHGWIFDGAGNFYSGGQFTFDLSGSTKTITVNNGGVVIEN